MQNKAGFKEHDMPSPASKTRTPPADSVVPDDSAVRVLRQFRQIFNSVKSHFQRMEKTSGLGGSQIWALSVIQERPNLGVTELAQAMDIRQSTASNLVKALVERELLVVKRHPGDRRAVQLGVMPAAKRLLRRVPGPLVGILPMALGMLDKPTLKRLEKDLSRLLLLLNADDKSAQMPLADL